MDIESGVEVLGHRVLIKPFFVEEVTDWGFQLDVGETHKREKASASIGKIVSIGPNAWIGFDDGKPWAEVGDTVHFAKYGGKFITYNDEEYVIVNDEDVQLRIRKDEE